MSAWLVKEKAVKRAKGDREEVIQISSFEARGYASYFCVRNDLKLSSLIAMAWAK